MGSVGLRMPDHLVSLEQSMNRLVGPVDLTELPRNGLMAYALMEMMNLLWNALSKKLN